MPDPDRPLRVLYVIGTARSGSTVLNTLLGSHPDIIGTGELGYLSETGHAFQEICSCGAPATDCVFWSHVWREWLPPGGSESIDDYVALQRRFEQGRFRPKESIPSGITQTKAYRQYSRLAGNLLNAVSRVSGKTIIVDSTKTPWRAGVLASLPCVEVRVLHLVRHPAGVVWSMKQGIKRDAKGRLTHQPPRSVVRSSIYWLIFNLQAALVKRHLPASHSLLVRYEDLVRVPGETMSRIGDLIGCDLDAVGSRAASGDAFKVEHTIAGNRLRMEGTLRLKMDSDWQNQLSPWEKFICGNLTGWLAKLYGYQNLLASTVHPRAAHN